MRIRSLHALALLLALACSAPLRAGVLDDEINTEEEDDYASLPLLRLAFDGGYSHWLYPKDSNLTAAGEKFMDQMRSGTNLSADAVWYPFPRGGVGLTWIWFVSRAQARDLVTHAGGPARDLSERQSITYLGPSFWTRVRAGRFGLVHAGFGAGYFGVLDTWTDTGTPHKLEARTFALVTSLGWDWSLFRYLGLGLNGRFVFSNLKEYTVDGKPVTVEEPAGTWTWYNLPLYRLELNAGLRLFL